MVGLRLVDEGGVDLIDPKSAAISIEPIGVECLAGRTVIVALPSLVAAGPGMLFGVVSVNDREVARVPIRVRQKTLGERLAGG